MAMGHVLIFGDSYSSFAGSIPTGHNVHYGPDMHPEYNVSRVEDMWWHRLLGEGDELVLNSSSSGTTICHTGYGGGDCSDSSFVARLERLADDGFFASHTVDTCLVFGGTNDSWANAPLGDLQYADWTKADLYSVLPAFCYLLHRLKALLPAACLVVIINCDLKSSVTEGLVAAATHYGVPAVRLTDVHKVNGHPTREGMADIATQVASIL